MQRRDTWDITNHISGFIKLESIEEVGKIKVIIHFITISLITHVKYDNYKKFKSVDRCFRYL